MITYCADQSGGLHPYRLSMMIRPHTRICGHMNEEESTDVDGAGLLGHTAAPLSVHIVDSSECAGSRHTVDWLTESKPGACMQQGSRTSAD